MIPSKLIYTENYFNENGAKVVFKENETIFNKLRGNIISIQGIRYEMLPMDSNDFREEVNSNTPARADPTSGGIGGAIRNRIRIDNGYLCYYGDKGLDNSFGTGKISILVLVSTPIIFKPEGINQLQKVSYTLNSEAMKSLNN